MKERSCIECGLPILEYKQVVQQCEDICESCLISKVGESEFPSIEKS
jgi:hypothetical protein